LRDDTKRFGLRQALGIVAMIVFDARFGGMGQNCDKLFIIYENFGGAGSEKKKELAYGDYLFED
jgi:hypothetical protein